MGATNTTTYYNLSQFVGTDKPAWLQDYNGDMLKIDTAINAAKVAADSAALDASAAQLDATTALGDITNTIIPAITSLQTTVGNQGGAINTINSLIGNGTPTTTDQTIIGAINEINGKVTSNLTTLITGLPSAGNQAVPDISGFRYIYLEMRFSSDLDSVATLIPIEAFKMGIRKTVSYYDTGSSVNHDVSIRYVDDTTIALGHNYATSVYVAGRK